MRYNKGDCSCEYGIASEANTHFLWKRRGRQAIYSVWVLRPAQRMHIPPTHRLMLECNQKDRGWAEAFFFVGSGRHTEGCSQVMRTDVCELDFPAAPQLATHVVLTSHIFLASSHLAVGRIVPDLIAGPQVIFSPFKIVSCPPLNQTISFPPPPPSAPSRHALSASRRKTLFWAGSKLIVRKLDAKEREVYHALTIMPLLQCLSCRCRWL